MAEPTPIEELKRSVEEINRGFEEFKSANDQLIQTKAKEVTEPLLEEKLKRIDDALDAHQQKLDEYYTYVNRSSNKHVKDENGDTISMDELARKWIEPLEKRRGKDMPDFKGESLEEYKNSFGRMLRSWEDGVRSMDPDDVKALSVGKDPDGGYTVTPDLGGRMVERVFETSPIRQAASITVISTDALEGVYDDDEAAANWIGEKGTRSETDTPELGVWRIPVHELYAFPKATQKIIDDSSFDLESWLARKVADKFARAENAAFVSGNTPHKPRGFLTYAGWDSAGVYQKGAIERFATGANGAFDTTAGGAGDPDVLLDVIYGMKAPYRQNAQWAMSRATTKLTRLLKDQEDRYLWQPSMTAGEPATLMGYGILPFEDMPDPGTDSLSIAFADWAEAYQIVDRIGIRVLVDPYTAKPYIGYYTTKRTGGDVVNFEAIKLVEFTA